MNKVVLKITGTQTSRDGETDEIEMITQGKYYKKNHSSFLVYDETELSGMEGSTTTLKIDDDKVMMKRFGKNESKLIFENGKTHKTIYKTIYGNMDMEVYTDKIQINQQAEQLKKLYISYRLNISGNIESKNTLSIALI